MADTTQTNTLCMTLAKRFSRDEIPSVLGLQLRTWGAYPQYWNFLKYLIVRKKNRKEVILAWLPEYQNSLVTTQKTYSEIREIN